MTQAVQSKRLEGRGSLHGAYRKSWRKYWDLYLLLLPVVAYFIIFKYIPMYGVMMAFKNFSPAKGILASKWVGLAHFQRFVSTYDFWNIIRNTVTISLYQLAVGFPIPIMLALVLNEMHNGPYKKGIQTITYAPYFLSTVVLVGMVEAFLHKDTGVLNNIIAALGGDRVDFMTEESCFKSIYVWSGVWRGAGWGSIVYMSALSAIDVQLYEAASIDGASRFKRLLYITIPSIIPTAVIMLILDCGSIMNLGFEKVYLMQNALNLNTSEVISTYVYKVGIVQAQYSYSTAVNLFNSLINLVFLLAVNKISKMLTESSLW